MADTFQIDACSPAAGAGDSVAMVRETYAAKRRLVTAAYAGQGFAMAVAGGFLIANLRVAPQLAVQAAILGGLLVVGGCALVLHSLVGATSHLTVDAIGVRGRFGWSAFDITWPDLRQWWVSDHEDRYAGLVSAQLWPSDDCRATSIPGGFLDRHDRRRLRAVLNRYAPSRERSMTRSITATSLT